MQRLLKLKVLNSVVRDTHILEIDCIQEPAEDKVELLSVDVLGVPDILDLSHEAKQ